MPRLNLSERNRNLSCGDTRTVVAGQYNVSRSTISRLVERINVTGTADDRPRSVASRVTSIRQDNTIRQRHLRDRSVTAQSTSHAVIRNRGKPIHSFRLRDNSVHFHECSPFGQVFLQNVYSKNV